MSRQSIAGKQAWQRRAPVYCDELREQIERNAVARFASWQGRARRPLWFRIKRFMKARFRGPIVRTR